MAEVAADTIQQHMRPFESLTSDDMAAHSPTADAAGPATESSSIGPAAAVQPRAGAPIVRRRRQSLFASDEDVIDSESHAEATAHCHPRAADESAQPTRPLGRSSAVELLRTDPALAHLAKGSPLLRRASRIVVEADLLRQPSSSGRSGSGSGGGAGSRSPLVVDGGDDPAPLSSRRSTQAPLSSDDDRDADDDGEASAKAQCADAATRQTAPPFRRSVNFVGFSDSVHGGTDLTTPLQPQPPSQQQQRQQLSFSARPSRERVSTDARLECAKLRRAVSHVSELVNKVGLREARERRRSEAADALRQQQQHERAHGFTLTAQEAWLTIVCSVAFFSASFASIISRINAKKILACFLIPVLRRSVLRRRRTRLLAGMLSRSAESAISRQQQQQRSIAKPGAASAAAAKADSSPHTATAPPLVTVPGVIETMRASPTLSKCVPERVAQLLSAARPRLLFEGECLVYAGEDARLDSVFIVAHGALAEVQRATSTHAAFGLRRVSNCTVSGEASDSFRASQRGTSPPERALIAAAVGVDGTDGGVGVGPALPLVLLPHTSTSPSPSLPSPVPSPSRSSHASRSASPASGATINVATFKSPSPASPTHRTETSNELSDLLGDGPVAALSTFAAGAVIGDASVVMAEPFRHTIRCNSEVAVVFAIRATDFAAFIAAHPPHTQAEVLQASKNDARKRALQWCVKPTASDLKRSAPFFEQFPIDAIGQLAVCLSPAVARPGERLLRDVHSAQRLIVMHIGSAVCVEEPPLEQVALRAMSTAAAVGANRRSSGRRNSGKANEAGPPLPLQAKGQQHPHSSRSPTDIAPAGARRQEPIHTGREMRRSSCVFFDERVVAKQRRQSPPPAGTAATDGARRPSLVSFSDDSFGSSGAAQVPAFSAPSEQRKVLRQLARFDVVGTESICMSALPPSNGNLVALVADSFVVVWTIGREEVLSVIARHELHNRLALQASRCIFVPPVPPAMIKAATPLFSHITNRLAQRIAHAMVPRVVIPGIALLREGTVPSTAFMVVAGAVSLCTQERQALVTASADAKGGEASATQQDGRIAATAPISYFRRVIGELRAGQVFGMIELLAEVPSRFSLICDHSAVLMAVSHDDLFGALSIGMSEAFLSSLIARAEMLAGCKRTTELDRVKATNAIAAENQLRLEKQKQIEMAQQRAAQRAEAASQRERQRAKDAQPLRRETLERFYHLQSRALQLQQLTIEHRVFEAFQRQLLGEAKSLHALEHDEYFARRFDKHMPRFFVAENAEAVVEAPAPAASKPAWPQSASASKRQWSDSSCARGADAEELLCEPGGVDALRGFFELGSGDAAAVVWRPIAPSEERRRGKKGSSSSVDRAAARGASWASETNQSAALSQRTTKLPLLPKLRGTETKATVLDPFHNSRQLQQRFSRTDAQASDSHDSVRGSGEGDGSGAAVGGDRSMGMVGNAGPPPQSSPMVFPSSHRVATPSSDASDDDAEPPPFGLDGTHDGATGHRQAQQDAFEVCEGSVPMLETLMLGLEDNPTSDSVTVVSQSEDPHSLHNPVSAVMHLCAGTRSGRRVATFSTKDMSFMRMCERRLVVPVESLLERDAGMLDAMVSPEDGPGSSLPPPHAGGETSKAKSRPVPVLAGSLLSDTIERRDMQLASTTTSQAAPFFLPPQPPQPTFWLPQQQVEDTRQRLDRVHREGCAVVERADLLVRHMKEAAIRERYTTRGAAAGTGLRATTTASSSTGPAAPEVLPLTCRKEYVRNPFKHRQRAEARLLHSGRGNSVTRQACECEEASRSEIVRQQMPVNDRLADRARARAAALAPGSALLSPTSVVGASDLTLQKKLEKTLKDAAAQRQQQLKSEKMLVMLRGCEANDAARHLTLSKQCGATPAARTPRAKAGVQAALNPEEAEKKSGKFRAAMGHRRHDV